MFMFSIVLLLLGTVFLIAEFHIPGMSVCGFAGAIMLIVSAVITVVYVPFGWFVVLGEAAGLCALLVLIFNYIRKRQLHGKLILDEVLAFESDEIGNPDFFQGKEGVTKTSLRPFGKVDFNGTQVEAYSDGAYIPENKKVRVVETTRHKIIVSQIAEQ